MIQFNTDSHGRQKRPHGEEGREAFLRRNLIIQHLIGILGREPPDLTISCFQIQLENANDTYHGFRKYINLSTLTEAQYNIVLKTRKSQEVFKYQ